ncbi:MAG: hypothetical protein A3G80_07650 [Betaproteobacteria bacterium RIFCSPLOWO2_12_FULL_62_13b]|nr:MAG: hypothetical protein A3G80_07650 [Betaproteobacteria bacterium RIFCSPLOWO2_12_FULL_62_13b]
MCSDLVRLEDGAAAPPARSAQRADGRSGGAAPRLDKRTYLDGIQSRWSIKGYDYGDGLCEIGWSFVQQNGGSRIERGNSPNRDDHEIRAVRRARSHLRRLVLSANADHLLTLTYRNNVTDFEQASADLARFIRRVKSYLPEWVYIAVPERQQRGAWHWHLAVIGWQDVDLLRSSWRHVVGDGNIDVQKPKSRTANRRLALVKYLGKYLAKGFKDGNRVLNGHRYRASLGIQVPCKTIELLPEYPGNVSQYAQDMLRLHAGSLGFVWEDEGGLMGWACSWG